MLSKHFIAWFTGLAWQRRIIAVIGFAVVSATIIAPCVFYYAGGEFGGPILAAALVTSAIVATPIVYMLVLVEKMATQAKQQSERRNEIFQSLLESSVAMQQTDKLVALLDDILMRLHKLLEGYQFGIIIDSNRPKMVRYFSSVGISEKENEVLLENNQHLLTAGKGDVTALLRGLNDPVTGNEVEWAFTPIKGRNGTTIGKIIVKGVPLSKDNKEVLAIFLEQLSVATENKLLTLELERMANTDQLTDVYNRNFFNNEFERLIERKIGKSHSDFSLLVIDINGLKGVNDSLGHVAGDKLICATATALKTVCRAEDCVARIGGDEFMVLCPSTDASNANRLVERIHERCQSIAMMYKSDGGDVQMDLHVSVGVSCSSESIKQEALISLADERMYDAKRDWYVKRSA